MIHLGLIGYPLSHSLSPAIHNSALKLCGLEGKYSLYPINLENMGDLKNVIARVGEADIKGLNVTIPHKQNVIPLLDELSPTARDIHAVNTIYYQEGKVIGDNTDADGFLVDLYRFLTSVQSKFDIEKKALVLGAGGSARAIVYALTKDGWKVTIVSRQPEQGQKLIKNLPNSDSQLSQIDFRLSSFRSLVPSLNLIINTTPVGMAPDIHASPWPTQLSFPKRAVVYDLVYNPRETKLVRDARNAGLQAISGLGMLVEQAMLSFELWTGRNVPREALLNASEVI